MKNLISKKEVENILEKVLSIPTAPFHEERVIKYILEFLKENQYKYIIDNYGNIIVEYYYKEDSNINLVPLGFQAHMDHPGLGILERKEDILIVEILGGLRKLSKKDTLLLIDRDKQYKVNIKKYTDESKRILEIKFDKSIELSKDAFLVPDTEVFKIKENMVHARAIDDLAGVSVLLILLKILKENKIQANIKFIFTRAEEMGFIGTIGLLKSNILSEEIHIINLEASKKHSHDQGNGVIIRIGDKQSIFGGNFISFLKKIADELVEEDKEFKFNIKIMEGGTCEMSVFSIFNYPIAGFTIPLGNYHNGGKRGIEAEFINFNDFYNLIKLCYHTILKINEYKEWKEEKIKKYHERFEKYKDKLSKENLLKIIEK